MDQVNKTLAMIKTNEELKTQIDKLRINNKRQRKDFVVEDKSRLLNVEIEQLSEEIE